MDSLRSKLDAVLTLSGLLDKLKLAWSRETSATPDAWRADRPSIGQCAVTALVVQDHFGGELVRVVADGHVSHYFNLIQIGDVPAHVDFTRGQFNGDTHFSEPELRERDYVLSYPATAARYALLKERLS